MNFDHLTKNQKLLLGLLFDAIGYIPLIDIVWAPLSFYLMTKMYKGEVGKVAGAVTFIEELLPLDIVPTFTITWLYVYAFKSKSKDETIIDVD